VAVDRAQVPDGAVVVGLAHAHRAHAAAVAGAAAGDEEAGFGIVDDVLDTFDGFKPCQIAAVFFWLVAVDGIHGRLLLAKAVWPMRQLYSSVRCEYVK